MRIHMCKPFAAHGSNVEVQSEYREDDVLVDLNDEVEEFVQSVENMQPVGRGRKTAHRRCPFCIGRTFQRANKILKHVRRDHKAGNKYCAMGAKQFRIAYALHRRDRVAGIVGGGYLKKSKELLEHWIGPHCKRLTTNSISQSVMRWTLCPDGPRVYHKNASGVSGFFCIPGGGACANAIYATREFADLVFQMTLVERGNLYGIRRRVLQTWRDAKSPVYMSDMSLPILGEMVHAVMRSREVRTFTQRVHDKVSTPGEMVALSVDCTVRMALKSVGRYKVGSVCSVIGLSGKLLGLTPRLSRSEPGQSIAAEVAGLFSKEELSHVRRVCTDNPSKPLWNGLRKRMPNLVCISLDGLHLILALQSVDKRSQGARRCVYYLRKVMHKLTLPDRSNLLGDVWTCGEPRRLDNEEREVLRRARAGCATRRESLFVLNTIDAESPYSSRFEFITYLAALIGAFPAVMKKVSQAHKAPVKQSILYAASPARAEYYLNENRFRGQLTGDQLSMLGTGTTRNEAEHHKLNTAFRTITCLGDNGLEDRLQSYKVARQLCYGERWQTTCKKKSQKLTRQSELLLNVVPRLTMFANSRRSLWWK